MSNRNWEKGTAAPIPQSKYLRFKEHPELIKKGKDNNMYGKHHSKETKRKMSESRMGNQNAKG